MEDTGRNSNVITRNNPMQDNVVEDSGSSSSTVIPIKENTAEQSATKTKSQKIVPILLPSSDEDETTPLVENKNEPENKILENVEHVCTANENKRAPTKRRNGRVAVVYDEQDYNNKLLTYTRANPKRTTSAPYSNI